MKTYASREAKNHFGTVLDTAQREPVTITRKGRPVAVVLSFEDYEKRVGSIRERLKKSMDQLAQEAEDNGLTPDILSEILNEK